jgi:hypothetical protein
MIAHASTVALLDDNVRRGLNLIRRKCWIIREHATESNSITSCDSRCLDRVHKVPVVSYLPHDVGHEYAPALCAEIVRFRQRGSLGLIAAAANRRVFAALAIAG